MRIRWQCSTSSEKFISKLNVEKRDKANNLFSELNNREKYGGPSRQEKSCVLILRVVEHLLTVARRPIVLRHPTDARMSLTGLGVRVHSLFGKLFHLFWL
jgi:hypothetical protein